MADEREGSRRTRWVGLVSLSLARLWRRATQTRSGRIATTLVTVAVTIALLLAVTGVALALAEGATVSDDDADVRIVPEESSTLSTVDGVERPRLGSANERAAELRIREGVDHATPVLVEPGMLESPSDGERRTVVLVGVVPDEQPRRVAGLPTDELEPGDPHYADGSYDGMPTREIVLSEAAADRLDAGPGDELSVPEPEAAAETPDLSVTVAAVEPGAGEGDVPVALVHASELQSFSGADGSELADRVIVWGDPEASAAAASDVYPYAAVESNAGADPTALFDDGLALAVSLLAAVVGIVICASFVATTAGMTVEDDRSSLAVMESIGIPRRGRLAIIAVSTLATTVCGALLGVAVGFAGIYGVNAVASATVAPDAVAVAHPLFVPYAVAVGLVAGAFAVPYPLAIAARTSVLAEVGR